MTSQRQYLLLLFLLIGLTQPNWYCYGQTPFPATVRRVVFLGNSITYSGQYVTAIEAWFRMHEPNRPIDFINVGLPSETVSGLSEEGHAGGQFPRPDLHERLNRVLAQTKPDLVFASYGMNDGIYLPFDTGRFQQFKAGMEWLHNEVVKTGASIIHLTPPIYDELKGRKTGYGAVLDRYADWLLSQSATQNWSVIDVHYPMKQFLEAHRTVDSTFALAGFALAEDGVHPGEVGHWLMARTILLGLGQQAVASAPDLKTALASVAHPDQFLKLLSERQTLMRDAWLTATGHKRPGLKTGLTLDEARTKAAEIDAQLKAWLP